MRPPAGGEERDDGRQADWLLQTGEHRKVMSIWQLSFLLLIIIRIVVTS